MPIKINTQNLNKNELEAIINIYEILFVKIFEFDNLDELADYVSKRISYFDKLYIDILKSDK